MSLDIQLKGKRILLKATVIYGGKSKVPKEKEKLKLQYRIAEINDGSTATRQVHH